MSESGILYVVPVGQRPGSYHDILLGLGNSSVKEPSTHSKCGMHSLLNVVIQTTLAGKCVKSAICSPHATDSDPDPVLVPNSVHAHGSPLTFGGCGRWPNIWLRNNVDAANQPD